MKAYLTKEADQQLHKLLDYLENEFSLKTSNAFLDKIIKVIETLEVLPTASRKWKNLQTLENVSSTTEQSLIIE